MGTKFCAICGEPEDEDRLLVAFGPSGSVRPRGHPGCVESEAESYGPEPPGDERFDTVAAGEAEAAARYAEHEALDAEALAAVERGDEM